MIDSFKGQYAFLSNFYSSPIYLDGKIWPTVEHYFQAMKSNNPLEVESIRCAPTPGIAKRMGRQVRLVANWDGLKLPVMIKALTAKFNQHSDLQKALLATGNRHLVEGNYWHDTYWGVCTCPTHRTQGQNMLGGLLMNIRAGLKLKAS